jgi:hypothetical protein
MRTFAGFALAFAEGATIIALIAALIVQYLH